MAAIQPTKLFYSFNGLLTKYYIYSMVPSCYRTTIQCFFGRNNESWLLASILTMKSLITSFLFHILWNCIWVLGAYVISTWYLNSLLNPSFVVNEWMPSRNDWCFHIRILSHFKIKWKEYETEKSLTKFLFTVLFLCNILKINFIQK